MKKFNYSSLESILDDFKEFNFQNPTDLSILSEEVVLKNLTMSNRFVIQPMEGADGLEDGSPGELTKRRYERFVRGGAGFIWMEAVAVLQEARTSNHQLWLTKDNVHNFKTLIDDMREWKKESFGDDYHQAIIIQLTHSGRFSKPNNIFEPIITHHNPYLNEKMKIKEDYPILTDEELEEIEMAYEEAAVLAYEAGVDGVDIKCSHRYLISELTSAYTREGKYGGEFSHRIGFLTNVVKRIRNRLGDKLTLSVRLNVYDGIPYPYGFGVDKDDYQKIDYTEPFKLIKILKDLGVEIINITMGSPYYYPHVNRPFDNGHYVPNENPIDGVKRLLKGAEEIQKAFPDLVVVGTGYSWLRQYAPYMAAGLIRNQSITMFGIGRMAYSYPDLPKDIIFNHIFDQKQSCITCSKCAQLKSIGQPTGCVIRDKEIYVPIYLKNFKKEQS